MLETVALFGPAGRNYVFTHAVSDQGGHPIDWVIAGQILWVVERRGQACLWSASRAAKGSCGIGSPARSAASVFKTTDAGKARSLASLGPFPINHDWVLDLDTSALSAAETANRIKEGLMSRLRP